MFGRYRIRGILEEGGMGRLYIAERTGIEGFTKVVVLKRILPHLAHDPQLREMFITEARVAARLDHPDIVTTFELGEVDGTYFMSMEYLPGEDLAKILSKCTATQPMPIEIAVMLAQRVADGLHYAHELPDDNGRPALLVHRDVNPCNIVVTYYGAVKLLDFGVVKETGATSTTFSGVFRGNYAYCAPEQVESVSLDRRTDVFSLGIVLWECLTAHRLFGGGTDISNIDAVRYKPIEPPSRLRPSVSPELDAIAMRCLSRDPARRFQNAADLSSALREFLASRSIVPNEQGIGSWLEQKFGAERCARKRAIGQGTEIEAALAYLQRAAGTTPGPRGESEGAGAPHTRPRVLWSTNIRRTPGPARAVMDTPGATAPLTATTVPTPPSQPAPATSASSSSGFSHPAVSPPGRPEARNTPARATNPGFSAEMTGAAAAQPAERLQAAPPTDRRPLIAAAITIVLAVAIAGAFAFRRSRQTVTVLPSLAAVEVRSDPPGANVMIDGSPTGLVTPTVLAGLPLGRSIHVEMSKDGYGSTVLVVTPGSAQEAPRTVRLVQTRAIVHLVDLPGNATVFLDGVQMDNEMLLESTTGRHQLRVELKTKMVFARDLDLQAGEQTISVGADGATGPNKEGR